MLSFTSSRLAVQLVNFFYFLSYLTLTFLMLVLYLNALDPYIEDSEGLGSFCIATSVFVFMIHRLLTSNERQLPSLNEQT